MIGLARVDTLISVSFFFIIGGVALDNFLLVCGMIPKTTFIYLLVES